ncbi:MAG TPA: glycosyltransferase family 39 protein [Chloroflexota bacterium]|nr:glycosyltransferase family 39 protein [Chloroflexota bacterium]
MLACTAFVVVALQFFLAAPILEGHDVPNHFEYVRTLAREHRFPDPHDPNIAQTSRHESTQYPLYYLLSAAVVWPIPTDDFDQIAISNPHFNDPRLGLNQNAFFHRPFEGMPSGAELAARVIELVSLICAVVTVCTTVLLARTLLPKQPILWIAAGLLVSALPAFDFLAVSVTNDNLVTALSSLTLLLLVLWLKRGRSAYGWWSALTLALAVLSKLNAIGLVVAYCGAACTAEPTWRRRMSYFGGLLGALTVVDGWWVVHMVRTFGDPSGVSWLKSSFPNGLEAPSLSEPLSTIAGNVVRQAPYTARTFIVNFNTDGGISLAVPALVLAIGLLGAAAYLIRSRFRPLLTPVLRPMLLWVLVMAVEGAGWLSTYDAPGRLLYPAIAPLAVAACAGWSWLLGPRWVKPVLAAVSAALVVVAGGTAWLVTAPKYAYPPRLHNLPATAEPLHVVFADSVELAGFESPRASLSPAGGDLPLTLYWRLTKPIDQPLNTFVHIQSLVDDYDSGASYDGAVGGGTYPPNFWNLGEVIVDHYVFHIRPRPGLASTIPLAVRVGMYAVPADHRGGIIPVSVDPASAADGGATLTFWRLSPAEPATITPAAEFPAVDLLSGAARQTGNDIDVHLLWRARSTPRRDLTVFVQLLSSDGRLIAQHDAPPLNGRFPTSEWQPDDQIADTVPLHAEVPPAPQDSVIVGLYALPSTDRILTLNGQPFVRLPLTPATGTPT